MCSTTLGAAAAADVRLIVWCKDCQHQVEPDPAETASRYGAEMPVRDRREPLVMLPLRQPRNRYGRDRKPSDAARPGILARSIGLRRSELCSWLTKAYFVGFVHRFSRSLFDQARKFTGSLQLGDFVADLAS